MWIQWLLDSQLASAAAELPLVNDLPLDCERPGRASGCFGSGQELLGGPKGATRSELRRMSSDTQGQDWRIQPFIPHRLQGAFYVPFIETIQNWTTARRWSANRSRDRYLTFILGAHRIGGQETERMGIPLGRTAGHSGHRKPWGRHMSGWLGKFWGTVQKAVRRELAKNSILCYKLLWFEDQPPNEFPELSIASVSTHDLPTIAGLSTGVDFPPPNRLECGPMRQAISECAEGC